MTAVAWSLGHLASRAPGLGVLQKATLGKLASLATSSPVRQLQICQHAVLFGCEYPCRVPSGCGADSVLARHLCLRLVPGRPKRRRQACPGCLPVVHCSQRRCSVRQRPDMVPHLAQKLAELLTLLPLVCSMTSQAVAVALPLRPEVLLAPAAEGQHLGSWQQYAPVLNGERATAAVRLQSTGSPVPRLPPRSSTYPASPCGGTRGSARA
jgi:hypothetical protein